MKAAIFYGNETVKVEEIPMPRISSKEVLIKVMACGICGSDRFYYFWDPDTYSGMIAHAESLYRDGKFHIIPGHEVAGVIVDVGVEVPDHIKKGDHVALYVFPSCEQCKACMVGLTHHCYRNRQLLGFTFDGGYAEYTKIHYSSVMKIPGDIPFDEATLMLDMVGVPLHAIKMGNIFGNIPKTMVVYGTGNLGLASIIALKSIGVQNIFAIDLNDQHLEVAKKLGATFTINPKTEKPLDVIMKLTEGEGVDVTLELVGTSKVQLESMKMTRVLGKTLLVGENYEKLEIIFGENMLHRELTVIASLYFIRDEFPLNVEFYKKNRKEYNSLLTHRFSLDDAQEAFNLFYHVKTLRTVIMPHGIPQ
ncbi:MAG: zinc-dependent alcohol dehydrogenase [Promethearchaeota archaeon]|jgi:L-iditol 2-dehydrogenase